MINYFSFSSCYRLNNDFEEEYIILIVHKLLFLLYFLLLIKKKTNIKFNGQLFTESARKLSKYLAIL